MKKNIVVLTSVLLLMCTAVFSQRSADMKWLTGSWKINTGHGFIIEQWMVVDDSTLHGKSLFVKGIKDTIPEESIELAYRNGDWYYIPTANGQNNNQPVKFTIILLNGMEFISENPAHDFPQRIAYRRTGQQLFASIEGKNKGKYRKQNFDFVKE